MFWLLSNNFKYRTFCIQCASPDDNIYDFTSENVAIVSLIRFFWGGNSISIHQWLQSQRANMSWLVVLTANASRSVVLTANAFRLVVLTANASRLVDHTANTFGRSLPQNRSGPRPWLFFSGPGHPTKGPPGTQNANIRPPTVSL